MQQAIKDRISYYERLYQFQLVDARVNRARANDPDEPRPEVARGYARIHAGNCRHYLARIRELQSHLIPLHNSSKA